MFYFGKSLQAAALAVTALALYVGLTEVEIKKELTMLVFGVALFIAGRSAEKRGSR